jgi:hypothetical protein
VKGKPHTIKPALRRVENQAPVKYSILQSAAALDHVTGYIFSLISTLSTRPIVRGTGGTGWSKYARTNRLNSDVGQHQIVSVCTATPTVPRASGTTHSNCIRAGSTEQGANRTPIVATRKFEEEAKLLRFLENIRSYGRHSVP